MVEDIAVAEDDLNDQVIEEEEEDVEEKEEDHVEDEEEDQEVEEEVSRVMKESDLKPVISLEDEIDEIDDIDEIDEEREVPTVDVVDVVIWRPLLLQLLLPMITSFNSTLMSSSVVLCFHIYLHHCISHCWKQRLTWSKGIIGMPDLSKEEKICWNNGRMNRRKIR